MSAEEQYASPQVEQLSDGRMCYVQGKNRIIITEHFPDKGKSLEDLLLELILKTAAEDHDIKNEMNKEV